MKSAMMRGILLVFAILLAAGVSAQTTMWSRVIPESRQVMLARDSANNLYMAATRSTIHGRQLVIQKCSPNGGQFWAITHIPNGLDRGDVTIQFEIVSLEASTTRLLVLLHDRYSGGTGAIKKSYLLAFDLVTGSYVDQYLAAGSTTPLAGRVAGNLYLLLHRLPSTGDVVLEYLNTDLILVTSASLGKAEASAGMVVDTSATAYVRLTDSLSGEAVIARVTPAGVVVYRTVVEIEDADDERIIDIIVDVATNRVYALVMSTFLLEFYRTHVIAVAADTGVMVHTSNSLFFSGQDIQQYPLRLFLIPSQGPVAIGWAAYVDSLFNPTLYLRALTPTLTSMWSKDIPTYAESSGPYFVAPKVPSAFDPAGNLLLFPLSLQRRDRSTGELLSDYGLDWRPSLMLTDGSGNFFVGGIRGQDAELSRIQPAVFVTQASYLGGTSPAGTIETSVEVPTNQVWTLSSSNPAVLSVPSSLTLNAGSKSVSFTMTTSPVASFTNVTLNARYQGFSLWKQVSVTPAGLFALSIGPNVVVGGTATQGTVTLNGKAPAGGRTVTLASNKTHVATVPASVTVLANMTSASFAITTFGVNANQGVVITATLGAVSKTAFFAVNAPSLINMTVTPGTIKGGLPATLTLTLNGIAPAGGFTIVLISGAPGLVTLPSTGSIPATQTNVSVNVPTSTVSSSTAVTLFATRSGIYRITTVTLTP